MKILRALLIGLSILLFPTFASAQDYPAKPIRLIVPFPPGGPNDIIARVIGQRMSELAKQPVVIDNRGGQGGVLGTEAVAKAAPDGYTIAISSAGALAISPVMEKVAYDTLKDLAPVTLVATVPEMLVVASNVPAKNIGELIALARAQPGKLNFASSGPGSLPHLAGELFKLTAKLDIVHVPYRGANPAMQDLMGGRVDYLCDIITTAKPQIDAGTVKPIAILTRERSKVLPDVPTAIEQGFEVEAYTWNAFFLPKGTPEAIVQKLNRATVEAMKTPAVREKLESAGLVFVSDDRTTPDYLAKFVQSEIVKWAAPIKAGNISVD